MGDSVGVSIANPRHLAFTSSHVRSRDIDTGPCNLQRKEIVLNSPSYHKKVMTKTEPADKWNKDRQTDRFIHGRM